MRTLSVLLVAAGLGCAPAEPADPCAGSAPPFEDCTSGLAWSDCGGGAADARFACRGADCRWFVHGCVAEGFEASSCPASDLCCHGGGPYEGPVTGSQRDLGVAAQTLAWGTEPWDASRERNVAVRVGSTSADARPTVSCTASDLFETSACDAAPSEVRTTFLQRPGVTIASVGRAAGFGGHAIDVEVTTDEAGHPRASVCSVPFRDFSNGLCATDAPRGCAISGSVTIEALVFDATTQLDVSATFADGSTLELHL
jgi:hypothetical protein